MRFKLLIVDDHADLRPALEQALQDDFHVLTGANYDDALAVLEWEPDVCAVIADLDLGDGPSGLDVLRGAQATVPDTLRILMSHEEGLAALEEALRTELVQRHVQKSGCRVELARAIRDSLPRPRVLRN